MKTKIIIVSVLLGLVFVADFLSGGEYCSYSCLSNYDGMFFNIALVLSFSLVIMLLLSLFPSKVFNSWWKFARIAIPVILIISILINLRLHHSPGGFLNLDDLFDIPIHIFMYVVFVLGSLVQIYRGWKN